MIVSSLRTPPLTSRLQMSISRGLLRHFAFSRDFPVRRVEGERIGIGVDPVSRNPFAIQYEVSAGGVIERAGYDDGNIASMDCRIALGYLLSLSLGHHKSQASRIGTRILSEQLDLPKDVLSAVVLAHERALSAENDSAAHRAVWPGRVMRGQSLDNSTHVADWRSRDALICEFEFSIAPDQRIVDFYFRDHSTPSDAVRRSLPLLAQLIEGRSIEEIEDIARQGTERELPADWGKLGVNMGRDALQQALQSILSARPKTSWYSGLPDREWEFHFYFPYHQGVADQVTHRAVRTEPRSGDIVEMGIVIENGVLKGCFFDAGNASALCRVSASMIAERVEGMAVDEILSARLSEILPIDMESEGAARRFASTKAAWLALQDAVSACG